MSESSWKCSKCGHVNTGKVGGVTSFGGSFSSDMERLRRAAEKAQTVCESCGAYRTSADEEHSEKPSAPPKMEACKKCGQLIKGSDWTCPHCGNTQWNNYIVWVVITLIPLGVAVFTSSWIRWVGAVVGLFFLCLTIYYFVNELKARKKFKK
jgi:ribosomal protein L32